RRAGPRPREEGQGARGERPLQARELAAPRQGRLRVAYTRFELTPKSLSLEILRISSDETGQARAARVSRVPVAGWRIRPAAIAASPSHAQCVLALIGGSCER